MSNNVLIAPSLLAADFLSLKSEVMSVENAGADWHHIDVMDGHFVPNLTFGLPIVRALKQVSKIPLDVHIMVSNPDAVAESYLNAGADILVFHAEAAVHPHRLTQLVKSKGKMAGIALNPATPLHHAIAMAPYVDVIMLMSVNPGFGGQVFISETIERICELKQFLIKQKLGHVRIEVDGGINEKTAKDVVAAGASILVAGTAVYGHTDRVTAIKNLRCS